MEQVTLSEFAQKGENILKTKILPNISVEQLKGKMITGYITDDLEPLLNDVYLRANDGSLVPIKTILDTGFNSTFCFPKRLFERLKSEYFGEGVFVLADGLPVDETIYVGEVIVDNQPYVVEMTATESDTALMGMEMLLEHEAIFNLKEMTVKVI